MSEIGKEYGTALFALALEKGAVQEYADALTLVEQALEQQEEYLSFLVCPSIPMGERTAALREAFGARVPEDVLSFLQLMCQRARIACLADALAQYRALLDECMRTVSAKVTCAVALSDEQKERLERKLEHKLGRHVQAEYEIDEQLLGGFVVKVDEKTLDASLRQRLREIKEVMKS